MRILLTAGKLLPVENIEIADRLETFALMLELVEANPYTIRAYRRAAETIRSAALPVEDLVRRNRVRELRGIGQGIEARLRELVETVRSPSWRSSSASCRPAWSGSGATLA